MPTRQRALAGYEQFRQLTERYADLVIQETRQHLVAAKNDFLPPPILLAQEAKIQQLIARFESGGVVQPKRRPAGNPDARDGLQVRQCPGRLVAPASRRPRRCRLSTQSWQTRKDRETVGVQGMFGSFQLERDYCYHAGKDQGY